MAREQPVPLMQRAIEHFEEQRKMWLDRSGPHMSVAWQRERCREMAAIYQLAINSIARNAFVAEVTSHMREGED